MNKISSIIITLGLIIGIGIVLWSTSKKENKSTENPIIQNVEIKDGIQYIAIEAKGGYLPRVSKAEADIPSTLIVKTNNTYDCSLALVIRSIGYQKMLQQTGEEMIDLGIRKKGDTLQATCSMGMYSFKIEFV